MSHSEDLEHYTVTPSLADRIFPGNSSFARACRSSNWAATSLGAPESWPACLRASIATLFASPLPMLLCWGGQRLQLYNEAYAQLLGSSASANLGEPVESGWSALWQTELPDTRDLPCVSRGSKLLSGVSPASFDLNFSPLFDDAAIVRGFILTAVARISEPSGSFNVVERAIDRIQARFRALATAGDFSVYRMSPDWQELRALAGGRQGERPAVTSSGWADRYIYPDDRPRVREAIRRARDNKTTYEQEHRVFRRDGSIRWIRSRAVPILNEVGEIVEWIGAASDVTERREAVRALHESEARYRFLFDSIDQGFCTVEVLFNADGRPVDYRYLELNPAFERHMGLKNVGGKTMRSLVPDHESYWYEIYGRVAKTGEPTRFEMPAMALGERWFDVYAFRIDAPQLNRVAILFNDISERKRSEKFHQQLAAANAFRLKLADALRPLEKPGEILRAASRILGEHLSASRVHYAELNTEGHYALVLDDYREGVPSVASRHRLDELGPTIISEIRAGRTLIVSNVAGDARLNAAEKAAAATLSIGACVIVPLVKKGQAVAIFVTQESDPRQWTEAEVKLMEETADRTWAAVERARAEAALRNALQRNTTILESIGDCFYALDSERRFTYVNTQAEAYLGMSKEQMLGRKYADVLPATRGHEVLRRQQEAQDERKTVRFEALSPVTGRWVELSVFPTDDGGLTVYFRDITDRVRARAQQEALIELGDRLRVLSAPSEIAGTAAAIVGRTLGAMRAGYGMLDASGEWLEVTEDWTDGASSCVERWRLQDYWGDLVEQLRAGEPLLVESIGDNSQLSAVGVQNFRALGVDASMCVPLVAEGRLVAVFYAHFKRPRSFPADEATFVRDVTDRTWAALQRAHFDLALRESDRRKDEFLAMLAHELRNPLAVIGNTIRLLQRELPRDDNRFIKVLDRQTDMLRGLVADLLDVSRITRGLVELTLKRVDMLTIARQALESVQAAMEEKRHRIRTDLPKQSLMVMGDPVRLEQILVNLLTNAAKYTDPEGQISLCMAARDGEVEVRVADSGIGMTREVLERIFDLFGQAERGLARSEGGLGIGLTIARNLVELHNGRIEARSEGPGKGAEFVLRLPLLAQEEVELQATAEIPAAQACSRRVLVVEDNREIAETMALLLKHAGHEVEVVNSGAAALVLAAPFQPEVVLLDIGLPEMDGYEIARRLRRDPRTASAVLAALTGYGQPSDRERTRAAGFDAHFVKPVDLDVLLDFVARAAATG